MIKGFKATLFAGCLTLSAFAPVFAAAPIISGLPDIQIGDDEDSSFATDSNFFVFSDAFSFDAYVSDADTPDNLLKWSFGEYTNPALAGPQYTINGVGPINNGDAAIAAEQIAGFPNAKNPGANQIDASSDLASFRDILFSPPPTTGPFPDPSAPDAAAAAQGKVIRFYVSDPDGNVDYQDTLIRTVDDNSDFLTDSDGYQEKVRDTNFTSGWVPSGINYPAGVTISNTTPGELNITVFPTQAKQRIYGWINPSLLPYDNVGSAKFVRGKFFINTTNSFASPLNQVPGFRLRLANESAVNAAVHYEYAQTGYTATPTEPFYGQVNNPAVEVTSNWIRPSDNTTTPSLYRVDLDPVDVANAVGSSIGALMESYAFPDPANGTLSLKEVVLGTYDAKTASDPDATLVYEYDRALGLSGGVGGAKALGGGGFLAEANFTPGYRQDLDIQSSMSQLGYTQIVDQGVNGVVADTDQIPDTVFGIGLMNITQNNNADRLRISPDKLYLSRFYATAPVPTVTAVPGVEMQGNLRFRFQTIGGTLSYLLDMSSVAGFSLGVKGDSIAVQALPGIGSANPDQDLALNTPGEAGGWYSVVVSSPLDADGIRADQNDNFGALGAEPGPGNAAASTRDVVLGVDLIQIPATLTINASTIPYGKPNRSVVRVSALKVYEYPSIDDGGYDY